MSFYLEDAGGGVTRCPRRYGARVGGRRLVGRTDMVPSQSPVLSTDLMRVKAFLDDGGG